MQQIVECVPNFSNGRDPEIYNGIAQTISAVRGVKVLNVSVDPDHNRSVITFVGSPEMVEEAAFRAIKLAAERINLNVHEGEHPRIGATDVCPFIPVKNVTTADCVAIAQRLGRRVGEELGIAVYLYGDAAARPERKKLSAIRKGEYELWKEEVASNPERQPDYGPAEAKPWGATVIGARPFLIAYNIYLNSDNVKIADRIARDVRFIGGGLRFVQAKGFLVDGQAQVSMNLTDFNKTPIYRVQELVRREAARYGLMISKAELIGMAPQKALMDTARYYLQLDEMQDGQVLELKIQDEEDVELAPHDFIEATASSSPAPGGGSTAALAGALAAALTQMVAGLTIGRKKYHDVSDQARGILEQASGLREALTRAIEEDTEAFNAVMAAYRDKSLEQEQKSEAVERATIKAADVPLRVAELSVQAAELAASIATIGNLNAVTDAAAGVIMAEAAVQVAGLNVKINAVNMKDQELAGTYLARIGQLEDEIKRISVEAQAAARERGGF
ncbi:MAG: glutamate formimidoyltransferase [Candidatus Promineifilaceae bacterium]|nr:glutamate formimidoyltransferase [Candidatus Promineifilaceae bacterium]